MSLISIDKLSSDVMLGIWKVEENVTMVLSRFPHLQIVANKFHNPVVCREKLAHYSLLYAMIGKCNEVIAHDENGKPMISGWNISISDSNGYVAILLAKKGRVGVDIEYYSDRVSRIASRFVRPDEDSSSVKVLLLNWTVKEAIYKYYSEQHLDFFDIRLHPTNLANEGIVRVDNMNQGDSVIVQYRMNDDYTLSYVYE